MQENVTVIGCDESGSEGENLMRSSDAVFVHGSVNLTLDQATNFIVMLRALTGARAPELKSTTVLAPRYRPRLIQAISALEGHANIYFVDKSFFVVAKMIALLPAELGERNGIPIHLSGIGPHWAHTLHRDGPAALGRECWAELLRSFNDLIRSYLRQGSTPPTVEPFFAALARARRQSQNVEVTDVLDLLWDARHLASEYEGVNAVGFRELDPMYPSLSAVARTWRMRLGDVPFEFLADNYSGLTESVRAEIVDSARQPLALGGMPPMPADLRGIRLTDSKLDARVQVADIVAGVGREVARLAVEGVLDDDLQNAAHQMLDYNVMSSGGSPLDRLVEREPIAYVHERLQRRIIDP